MGGMSADDIGREVNKWDESRWRRDIEGKTTLELYKSKRNIGDEGIY